MAFIVILYFLFSLHFVRGQSLAKRGAKMNRITGSPILVRAAAAALTLALAFSSSAQSATESATATQPACQGWEFGNPRVAVCESSYPVSQSAGSVSVIVKRGGTGTSAISVDYTTANGTAAAGANYKAASGVLSWGKNDWTPRTISIPITTAPAFSGNKSFTVALSKPSTGVSVVYPASATVTITGAPTTAVAQESVAFPSSTYSVTQSAGSISIPVNRSGGTTGAVTVAYATSNGTAVAGQNYTAKSGTLSWAAGDASAKPIVVPISSTVISGPMTFAVALSKPTGATIGSSATANVSITKSSSLAISISGNHLIDENGNTVQLRGVNVSGLEGVAILGWDPSNPWGNQTGTPTPNWTLIKTWGVNAVRLPINEASWLGKNCVDVGGTGSHFVNGVQTRNSPGELVSADPGHNYQATVATSVSQAAAAGLYVILDLHLAAPSDICPNMQNAMADADNSITFWSSFANAFKAYPNVIFELFNEPFLDQAPLKGSTPFAALMNGGTLTSYSEQGKSVTYTWQTAGMQAMLNAVRATGATNVVLTSTPAYSSDLGGWLQNHPTDTLNPSQVGAVWHAYPAPGYPSEPDCIGMPTCSPQLLTSAKAIRAAGYPVVITEFGDPIGGSTAPLSAALLPFADANGISYLAWTWDAWGGNAYILITDAAGDPTVGYGQYVKAHYLCRAAGTAVCP
jgi:endoglucanase